MFFWRWVFTPAYFTYFVLATLAFNALFPLRLCFHRRKSAEADGDFVRAQIYRYGRFALAASWPWLRISSRGLENLPAQGPVVFVLNHRSATDAFFAPVYAFPNTVFFVRSWPFRIPLFGWFMRRAGYIDSEKISFFEFLREKGAELKSQGLSFIFFPEGHRSPDGKLHRFRSGAFEFASEHNLPVVPVCMTGTDVFCPVKHPRIQPARVSVQVLLPVLPSDFPVEDRTRLLKKHVEAMMKECLNE